MIHLIDSRKRVNPTANSSSDFSIKTLTPLKRGRYELVSFTLNNGIYNINSYNNVIHFRDSASGGSDLEGKIAEGFYEPADLPSAIKTAMDGVSSTTYTVTLNSVSQKITFTPATGTCEFRFSGKSNGAYRALGYKEENIASGSSQTSAYPVDLLSNRFIRVIIDHASSGTDLASEMSFSFLVPLSATDTSVYLYENSTTCQSFYLDRNVALLKIRLEDEQGNLLLLNDRDWYCVVRFTGEETL
jgi:hypothetical protein